MLATSASTGNSPASRIHPKLWQGGAAMLDVGRLQPFQVLVLCAAEIQPSDVYIPKHLKVIRCPLNDVEKPISDHDANLVMHTARRCARSVLRGRRTLITCQQGLNRSGLVTATTLHLLTGKPGVECVKVVQRKRPGALFNRQFVRSLYGLY